MKSFLAVLGAVMVTAVGMYSFAGRKAETLRRSQEAERAVWLEKEKALEQALDDVAAAWTTLLGDRLTQ